MNVMPIQRREFEPDRSPEGHEEDQGAQLKHLYAALLRRWAIIVPAGLIVFALVFAFALLSPRIYTATALVMVNPGREQVLAQDQMIENAAPSSSVVDSEIEVLRSPLLRQRLVTALSLEEDPEWNGALRPPSIISAILAPLGAVFTGNTSEDASAAGPDGVRNSIADAVGEAVTVRRRGLSYGIEVSVASRSPRRAAEMANKLVELYLQSQVEARFDAAQRGGVWLGGRLDELRAEVQQKEQAAEEFRSAHGLSMAAGGEGQPQSEEVQTMLVQARADVAEKEARLRQVNQLIDAGGSADSIASVLNSPVISELRGREGELARELARLQERYSDEHPSVQTARTQLENAREGIREEVARITANLQNEVTVARARLGTLQGSFGDAAGARGQNSGVVVQYRQLVREAAAARAVHESFLERSHEVANQGALPSATSRLVSPATSPQAPTSPNLQSALMLALLLGALAGGGLGFLIEMLDASLSSAEDVERKVGASAVASIPLLGQRDFKGLTPDRRNPADYLVEKPMSGFAEALRVLRTAILHARLDDKVRVVAITSAVPNEGKTTMSLCLARISALAGQRVLLIDCDLRRKSMNDLLGIDPQRGLLEVLSGETDWRQVLIEDRDSTAHVLPAVGSRFTPQDVFSSQAMRQLIEAARGAYDLVILDCAPILAIAETRTLVMHADVIAIVARADKTPAAAVQTAIREVRSVGADVLGVALNHVDPRRPGRGTYGDSLYYRQAQKNYYHN